MTASLPHWFSVGADLLAIVVVAFGIYFPRHRRRDLLFAYVTLNVGVLAVTAALGSATITAGLGLGLFGVLSIIRLRSSELTQAEVAYYFVALAMGLLGGLTFDPSWAGPALIALIVVAVFVTDHPATLGRYRHLTMTLDAAYVDEVALAAHLEALLGADVRHLIVHHVDQVRDTTTVDVRYRLRAASARAVPAGVEAMLPASDNAAAAPESRLPRGVEP